MKVAGARLPESGATQRLAIINTVALLLIAIASPILGAVSDDGAMKKRQLGTVMSVGVAAVAGMFFVQTGDLGLASALLVRIDVVVPPGKSVHGFDVTSRPVGLRKPARRRA